MFCLLKRRYFLHLSLQYRYHKQSYPFQYSYDIIPYSDSRILADAQFFEPFGSNQERMFLFKSVKGRTAWRKT